MKKERLTFPPHPDPTMNALLETDNSRMRLSHLMEKIETLTEDMPFYTVERHRKEKRNLGRLFRTVEDELSAIRKGIDGLVEMRLEKSKKEVA